jgi:hypothetical protein
VREVDAVPQGVAFGSVLGAHLTGTKEDGHPGFDPLSGSGCPNKRKRDVVADRVYLSEGILQTDVGGIGSTALADASDLGTDAETAAAVTAGIEAHEALADASAHTASGVGVAEIVETAFTLTTDDLQAVLVAIAAILDDYETRIAVLESA